MATLSRSRASRSSSVDLSFDEQAGPVVAIAALCGGAGASTLTYLAGAAAARDSTAPILAIDAGGPTGGLAFYADVEAPYSLAQLAALAANGEQPAVYPFAQAQHGVRVLATGPHTPGEVQPEAIQRVIADARARHALTLIDCGTLTQPGERIALAAATHIVWLLPATGSGVGRAKRLLATLDPFRPGQEIVCARRDQAEKKGPMIPDLASHPVDEAIEAASLALQALATCARR
jgi:Flp pilus assembly CpaE family ATPase